MLLNGSSEAIAVQAHTSLDNDVLDFPLWFRLVRFGIILAGTAKTMPNISMIIDSLIHSARPNQAGLDFPGIARP
ncbi:hypothetical protein [Propionivibrio sp.]|uniref:hypothetical protein n=1 Tax=Propionivibrio sp. TaxID=2212460 RepID=UPI003BF39D11